MARQDFSEYEKHRAAQHEMICRLAATMLKITQRLCRDRRCRRAEFCSGPMVRSDLQAPQVAAQKELGLTGEACAFLPRCAASAPAHTHRSFRDGMNLMLKKGSEADNDEIVLSYARTCLRKGRRGSRPVVSRLPDSLPDPAPDTQLDARSVPRPETGPETVPNRRPDPRSETGPEPRKVAFVLPGLPTPPARPALPAFPTSPASPSLHDILTSPPLLTSQAARPTSGADNRD